ncbi:MAG: Maf family protein [Planctomycetaceae bacterium]|jgi:septum formation protein|nr:Maf family protein [Planctomycetaceae bacterium]MBT6157952.1 Maf family protein [Planctomycetaceae bacterium]MBT6487478.1 Maf family protein [Planctomycetaceae bacterium]MBT6495073.1 Maf family protein [Planctomycetaceae bacterium]
MRSCPTTVVLGSRSPRRRELLQLLVAPDSIRVLPPTSRQECGFDGLHNWPSIESRLAEVASTKCDDVLSQLKAESANEIDEQFAAVLTADTIIVVTEENGRLQVLGQPPEDDSCRDVVRNWFHRYYLGRTHTAATAICVATPAGRRVERVVTTRVSFHPADEQTESQIDWYLATGESQGKAGGYALQGAGGVFISAVEGSVHNVVGLPLRELLNALSELEIDVAAINN